MDLEKVTKIYKETNLSTMSMIEYVLLLLKECLYNVRNYGESESSERNEPITKAQKIVFELMVTVDRGTSEGERLFTFYKYVNQCLVEVRLNGSEKHLNLVEQYLLSMIASWEDAKPPTQRIGYTQQDLRL